MLYECEFCGKVRHPTYMGRTSDGWWFCLSGCSELMNRRTKILNYMHYERAIEWEESNLVTKLLRLLNSMEKV